MNYEKMAVGTENPGLKPVSRGVVSLLLMLINFMPLVTNTEMDTKMTFTNLKVEGDDDDDDDDRKETRGIPALLQMG